MPVSPARTEAFEILLRTETTDAYASELLHSRRVEKLSRADHGLLTELIMGVLRWRSALDKEIAEHSSEPLAKLDREVLTSLRLGAYQLLFLDRIPPHAAINESVELVKRARKKSAAGMVNAILRKVAVSQDRPEFGPPSPELSHPQWLLDRWRRIYGPEVTNKICAYNQTPPRAAIRVTNLARPSDIAHTGTFRVGAGALTRPVASDQLGLDGLQLEPGQLVAHAAIALAPDISRTAAFNSHSLVVQDEASQLIALLFGAGKSILDCCAAPGGKTRIIAERNANATVLAMDLHPHRARLVRKLVPEPNVHVICADARHMPFARKFDRILVDSPCSGTGTLGRNPEIKWRLSPHDIMRLQAYQLEILTAALQHVSQSGRVIYSTCSLEPEENQYVIAKALAVDQSFKVIDCADELRRLKNGGELVWKDIGSLLVGPFLRTVPGLHPCDGFFAAVLEKL
jgi:16S rRNA (cytosine967-C5)-methyltransferase